jgi:hypothetical protein
MQASSIFVIFMAIHYFRVIEESALRRIFGPKGN